MSSPDCHFVIYLFIYFLSQLQAAQSGAPDLELSLSFVPKPLLYRRQAKCNFPYQSENVKYCETELCIPASKIHIENQMHFRGDFH